MKTITLLTCLLLITFWSCSFAQGVWTNKETSLWGSREGSVGFSIGSQGYQYGGTYGYPDLYYSNTLTEYDTATNTWELKEYLNAPPRQKAVGFSIGNKGYVGTGGNDEYPYYEHNYFKDFWEYDPSTDTWSQKADFGGLAREGAVGFNIGNKGYVGTGYGPGVEPWSTIYFKDFWEYDPVMNAWLRKSDFGGAARGKAGGLSIGNKGYIGTGEGQDSFSGQLIYYRDFWEYNPFTDIWTKKTEFSGNALSGNVGFSIGRTGYFGKPGLNNFWGYNPDADTWEKKANYGGIGYSDPYGFSIGSKGYMGTGKEGWWWDDNEFWEYNPDINLPPFITSFSPVYGPVGTSVTINGSNFNTSPADNIVYFGATKATVTTASYTSLTVIVPVGATYQPITVTTNNLTAYSAAPFIVTFGGSSFTANSFASKIDFATGAYGPSDALIGDLDGDGKADVVTNNLSSNNISVFRNTGTNGMISFSAPVVYAAGNVPFAPRIMADLDGDGKLDLAYANNPDNKVSVFKNISSIGNIALNAKLDIPTGNEPNDLGFGDIDGDGKTDMVTTDFGANAISVLRNTSIGGNISFASKVDFPSSVNPRSVTISDIDGDGKPDLVIVNIFGTNTMSVFRNTSSGGSISFAPKVEFATNGSDPYSAAADLDGDSKPDIIVANVNSKTISVFRNISEPGTIAFATRVNYTTGSGSGPYDVTVGDLDGDGKPDIAVADTWKNFASIFKNRCTSGLISFYAKVDYAAGPHTTGINIGDLDGDRRPDLVTANQNSSYFSVLRNLIEETGWTRKADFGGAGRQGAVGFSIGNKGYLGTGGIDVKDFWEYDPVANTWTQKADFGGRGRSGAVGFSIGNKGYIGTGYYSYGNSFLRDFWEFDPAANTWTQKADFGGVGRNKAVGFSIGSKGYIGTGHSNIYPFDDDFKKDLWEYAPATNTWTQKADFGGDGRMSAVGFSIASKGYIGTGYDESYTKKNDFWEYDPAANAWKQKADFGGTARESAVGFSIGNKGYLGTGYDDSNIDAKDFWEYDPSTNTWTQKADFGGGARHFAVGFSIGSKGYLGTGFSYDGATPFNKDFWEYIPDFVAGCNPPSGLNVTGITKTSATLKWNLPEGSVPVVKVRYRTIGSNEEMKRLVNGTDGMVKLYKLQPNTMYEWAVFSVCTKDDKSAWIKGPDFTTEPAFASASGDAISDAKVTGKTGLQITPNPNKGNFTVQMQLPAKAASTTIALYNNFGQLVWQQNLGNVSGTVQRTIALENKLSAGLYTLTIQRSDIKLNQKMLINK